MTAFEQWCRVCPAATASTAALYAAGLYLLAVPRHRRWAAGVFAPPAPSARGYSGALDGYRGLAAAMVAFAHMVFWCYPVFWASKDVYPYLISYGGNKAVPVFVMLSGFLIYRSVRRAETAADLREYAARRLLRIYPLYLAAVVALVAVGQQSTKPGPLAAEVLMLRALDYPAFGNPVAWSLYVEVCFYVFLPVYVAAAGRRVVPLSAGLFAALAVADPAGPREMYLWKYFFLGILASHLADGLAAGVGRWAREAAGLALAAGGVWLMRYDFGGKDNDWAAALTRIPHNPAEATLGLGLGFGLLLVGTMCSGLVSRAAGVAPLRFLGTISYSVFLIHPFYILANFPQLRLKGVGATQPFFQEIGTAPWWYGFFVFAPGLLLWASVSYALIERPFLRLRPGVARPAAAPAAVPAAPPEPPVRLAA